MKKIKSTTIICNECGKKIEITADDAIIRFKFCGGCPGLSVTVKCSHCNDRTGLCNSPQNALKAWNKRKEKNNGL